MTFDARLPDDLEEIARAIPRAPRGLGQLRQVLALLPTPALAVTQGSFPADELLPPENAGDQLGTQPGSGSVGPGAISDGAIGAGKIRDGALKNVAVFAATIRPVVIVPVLPALPHPDHPPDASFVYNLGDVPPALYKNEGDVWVKLVGAADIQANSITAGQIAAGAVSTSELAVGARLTGEVANETGASPGVFIDSTGILIRSGKLTMQDEFGLTTLFASGFVGSWGAFLQHGLYNGGLKVGIAGVLANGRTAALPYWTLSSPDGATAPTATFTATGVSVAFSQLNKRRRFVSDRVPVQAFHDYEFGVTVAVVRVAGSMRVNVFAQYYDEAGTLVASPLGAATDTLFSSSTTTSPKVRDIAPDDAVEVELVIDVQEEGTHNAGNSVRLIGAWMMLANEVAGDLAVNKLLIGDNTVFPGPSAEITAPAENVLRFGATPGSTAIMMRGFSGTTFPSSPGSGDRFYRTDLEMWFSFSGARWVSDLLSADVDMGTLQPFSASSSSQYAAFPDWYGTNIYLDSVRVTFFVASGGSALSASHKWEVFGQVLPGGGIIGVDFAVIDSGASGVWRKASVTTINNLLGGESLIRVGVTKTGTPGDLTMKAVIAYRVVAA